MEVADRLVCESGAAYLHAGREVRCYCQCQLFVRNVFAHVHVFYAATFSPPRDPR